MPTADEIVSVLASIPLVGRPLVNYALNNSTQRHRCNNPECGIVHEVVIKEIVRNPLAVMSDRGQELYAKKLHAMTAVQEEGTSKATAAAAASASAAAAAAASTASSSDEKPPKQRGLRFFECGHCKAAGRSGRLGVHCYASDSTGGKKEVLMKRILKIFECMPDVIEAGALDPESAKKITVEDIHWVD